MLRLIFRGGAILLLGVTTPAQIPSDIATRDLATALRMAEEAQRIQRLEKGEQDRMMTDLRDRFVNEAWLDESAEKMKSLVFLPPLPPVLGQAELDPMAQAYPAILAEFAGETFFMAYGSLYFRRLLPPAQARQVSTFLETRDQLLAELRRNLTAAAGMPAAAAQPSLDRLAARQQDGLRALEAQAEKIREDLSALDDGSAVLNLRDKVPPGESAALRDYFSAIHAAHYQGDLSLEQRQLLLEIAFGSLLSSTTGAPPVGFFLPSPARLSWTADPAGELALLLTEFRDQSDRLKTELKAQVVEQPPVGNRTRPHRALATQQAPRFDELHRLADRIRGLAASRADPGQPAPTGIPPELVHTVGQAVADKDAFQTKARRIISRLGREFAPLRFKLGFRDKLPMIESLPAADHSVPAAATKRLQETNERLKHDHHVLTTKLEAARLAIQRYRETLGPHAPETGKLAAQLAQTHAREENWRRFADYRSAVLTPGLSPAQRRLLFNAALRDLEKHRLQSLD